jgi:hypothetical protein
VVRNRSGSMGYSKTLILKQGIFIMDMKKLLVTVVTALVCGVLTWQLNTVNNLETDVEVMKYKIEELQKDVKSLKKRKKSK